MLPDEVKSAEQIIWVWFPIKIQIAVINQVIFTEELTDEKNDLYYLEFSSVDINGLRLIRFVF